MRLAVFTSQFPSKVSTFFARDMRALVEAGIEVDIFPIYELDESLWKYVPDILSEKILPRERVHHLPVKEAMQLSTKGMNSAFNREAAAVLASALRYGPAAAAKSAYVMPKALAWAAMFPNRFDHVLGYWGNYAATCAYLFTRSLKQPVPFSIFLHAGTDLYRDQVFLKQKIHAACRVITCSDFNRDFLQKKYPELFPALDRKLHVYHHGLDFAEFPFQVTGRLPDRVIAVGNFREAKGFDYLIQAGSLLKSRGVSFTIGMVGDGPQKAQLEKMAQDLNVTDRVIFHGWQPFDEVRKIMSTATILVHPSSGLGDGVPNVLKEAIALGLPVIASNVSGLPEALDGGKHGLLVPPRDVNALADAIQSLLQQPDLRRQFAQDARNYAAAKYDLWRNGRELANVLLSAQ